jgi:endoglycosylceramidase
LLAGATSEGKNISIEKARFLDKFGRHLIFHGVNVVYKVPPYLPDTDDFDGDTSLTEQDMADLAAWGINFVRLGVMWEAVEKEAGVYDLDYLDKVQTLINKLGEHGIYTLVDAH